MTLRQGAKAAQIAWTALKARNSGDSVAAAKKIASLFAQEKGLFFKLAQMMGTAETAAEHLYELTKRTIPLLSSIEVKDIFEKTFHVEFDSVFANLTDEVYSASLGQVNGAYLKSGEQVVIKTLFPDVRKELKEQFALLNWSKKLIPVSPMRSKNFEFELYIQDFTTTLERECSYLREVEQHKKFRDLFRGKDQIVISDIVSPFVADQQFVQTKLEGMPLDRCELFPDTVREHLCISLLSHYLRSLCLEGFCQADFHPGNVLFARSPVPSIAMMDFGHCLELSRQQRTALLKLINLGLGREQFPSLDAFGELGFDVGKLELIESKLDLLVIELFLPFRTPGRFFLKDWGLKKSIEAILGDDKWIFRAAGPPWFFFLIRSFWGMCQILKKLSIGVDWNETLHRVCGKELDSVKKISLPCYSKREHYSGVSSEMHILVKENGKQKVKLQLPARAIYQLEELIPLDARERIEKRGISLKTILKETIERGCEPGEVFKLDDQSKSYHVWLA